MDISYSIPTYLSDFKSSDNGRTYAKLKVFYVGETGDRRVFSKEFAEKLVETLPNCPVVGFYSDLKDDFCGHNSTQYVYGIVPSDAEYGFELDENGVEWLVTSVLLYTDRIDNIGEVAQKIVGHPHSLEMHPETTKYEIRMEDGKRKIYFTEGSLVGLSVLGMQEKPAFKGSEFFAENTDLREKFENFISFLENKDRGASMNKEQFEKLYSFITLSYQEKEQAIHRKANEVVGDSAYAYIAQCFDDYCIIGVIDWSAGTSYYKKASYTIDENGEVTFGEFESVYPRYITEEEMNSLEQESTDPDFKKEDDEDENDCVTEEEEKDEEVKCNEDEEEQKDEEVVNEEFVEEEQEDINLTENGTSNEGENDETLQQTFSEEPEQVQEDSASNSTSLSDSEREELEALRATQAELEMLRANQAELEQFRLEKRVNLVNSYKEELSADTIASFLEMAKTASYEELESKLAVEFVKVSRNKKQENTVAFSFSGINFVNEVETTNSYESLVKRYSRK